MVVNGCTMYNVVVPVSDWDILGVLVHTIYLLPYLLNVLTFMLEFCVLWVLVSLVRSTEELLE